MPPRALRNTVLAASVASDNASAASSLSVPSTPVSESESNQRKRTLRAKETWGHSRAPEPGETLRKSGNRIWYCKYPSCNPPHPIYLTLTTNNARGHLLRVHGIVVEEEEGPVRKSTEHTIQQAFSKASEELHRRKDLEKDTLLASLIKKDVVFEALARLIVARNLPYNCIEWPELRSLLIICNPAINPILINSHTTIPFIIEQSYKERKAEVKAEMRDSEHQIHLSIDG